MIAAVEPARSELAALVGESRVVSDEAERAAYSVDGKLPKVVVYPPAAEQVAAVLKSAAHHDLAVIPCRNATKLHIGNPPQRYDIALSLKELNRVWYYEPADLTVSVEPGMKFGDFQHFVGRHGLWLPLDPPGDQRASLGGILATNSCGPLRLFYGSPRDMVLGMKIATTEGKVIKTGGRVVKNVAGYDLAKLLIGSYGTLGVIVEASLKLYPLPPERSTFVFQAGSLAIARDLRKRILQSPLTPLRMVLLNAAASMLARAGTSLAAQVKDSEFWIEVGGSRKVIDRYARELEELGRVTGMLVERLGGEDVEALWTRVSDFYSWLSEAYPGLVVLKALLPIDGSEEFLRRAQRETENEKIRLASFSQTGVGVVHLGLLDEDGAPAIPGLLERLRGAAEGLGGALVVDRCPSELKARVDVWGALGNDFEIMRKLKVAWDPKGVLAPGRYVGSL